MVDSAMRAAIVYLVQLKHSSYARESSQLGVLQESLTLLHRHFNARFGHDVLLFHTGDFDDADTQRRALAPIGNAASHVRFERVPAEHWSLPPRLATANKSRWYEYPRYSLGYRHMIRWFTIGLWSTLERLQYTHVMRMDDDSKLLSPISYDLFSFMASKQLDFGFRLASYESGFDGERFHNFIRRFLVHSCRNATRIARAASTSSLAAASHCAECHPAWLLDTCGKHATIRDFSLKRCGELFGMYNNFFISRVGFWRSANVQRFLRYVDQSGYIYSRRYGDLQLQSIAVQIYAKKERVHMFDDFTYQHGTTMKRSKYLEQQPQRQPAQPPPANASDECINFGGIAAGTNDTNGYQSVLSMVSRGNFCRMPCLRVYLHNRKLVLAATAGQVKAEQPDCHRTPPPYHCFASGSLVAETMQEATTTVQATTTWQERTSIDKVRPLSSHQNATTAMWAQAAMRAAPLGTCTLPPSVQRSACGEAISQVRKKSGFHNLASGIRFGCPSSIHRYLVACRPESGCTRPETPWYAGREELSCDQRAVIRREKKIERAAAAAPDADIATDPAANKRHNWLRHQCERLSSMPPTDDAGAAKALVKEKSRRVRGKRHGQTYYREAAETDLDV